MSSSTVPITSPAPVASGSFVSAVAAPASSSSGTQPPQNTTLDSNSIKFSASTAANGVIKDTFAAPPWSGFGATGTRDKLEVLRREYEARGTAIVWISLLVIAAIIFILQPHQEAAHTAGYALAAICSALASFGIWHVSSVQKQLFEQLRQLSPDQRKLLGIALPLGENRQLEEAPKRVKDQSNAAAVAKEFRTPIVQRRRTPASSQGSVTSSLTPIGWSPSISGRRRPPLSHRKSPSTPLSDDIRDEQSLRNYLKDYASEQQEKRTTLQNRFMGGVAAPPPRPGGLLPPAFGSLMPVQNHSVLATPIPGQGGFRMGFTPSPGATPGTPALTGATGTSAVIGGTTPPVGSALPATPVTPGAPAPSALGTPVPMQGTISPYMPLSQTSALSPYSSHAFGSPHLTPPQLFYSVPISQRASPTETTVEGARTFDIEAAKLLLAELDLDDTIDDYVDNLRRFLGKRLQEFARELLEREISVQPVFRPPAPHSATYASSNLSLQDMIVQLSNHPLFQSRRRPGVNLLLEQRALEKYLDVRNANERGYVLQRMRALSGDGYLGKLRWDGGGSWKGREWSRELPSDAHILMHFFCTSMDSLLPASYEGDRPFTRSHYMDTQPSLDAVRGRFLIYLAQAHPPTYKVVCNGKFWEILPGRHNCFHAIILFLYAVKQYKSGHLSNISLSHLLEDIFEE